MEVPLKVVVETPDELAVLWLDSIVFAAGGIFALAVSCILLSIARAMASLQENILPPFSQEGLGHLMPVSCSIIEWV